MYVRCACLWRLCYSTCMYSASLHVYYYLRPVHSRPRVGRASAARQPHAADLASESQRSLRCVDACVTVAKHWKSWKSHYNMTLVTSFDAFDARGRRIVVHSWSGKLSVGRNASTAVRRPQCVCRNAADYVLPLALHLHKLLQEYRKTVCVPFSILFAFYINLLFVLYIILFNIVLDTPKNFKQKIC